MQNHVKRAKANHPENATVCNKIGEYTCQCHIRLGRKVSLNFNYIDIIRNIKYCVIN